MSANLLLSRVLAVALMAGGVVALSSEASAEQRNRRVERTIETPRGTLQQRAEVRRERGQRTRDATITGPNGGETSVHDERAWSAADGTYNHDRVRTFVNGDTRTVDVDAERTGAGEWTAHRTVTGRNGETREQTGTVSRNP